MGLEMDQAVTTGASWGMNSELVDIPALSNAQAAHGMPCNAKMPSDTRQHAMCWQALGILQPEAKTVHAAP